ncbi:MAG: YihA family ribosome biogenesis GTP-binding protein [Firmicutes bacterium]|nr:YihA family ribosome biogenesis GTP-binding protein [Bacillota bacterium]
MKIVKAEFIGSAAKKTQYPPEGPVEIAFAGRSNVGKSSLINLLTGRKNLAKVSGNPGKTRTINFFDIDGSWRIVDLPGYGYAKVSKAESESWGKMMEDYLENRESLATVVQLVDCRHEPTAQDIQMFEYLRYYGLSGIVVATKADKLSKSELNKNLAMIKRTLELDDNEILIAMSALKKTGTDRLLEEIGRYIDG